MRLTSTHNPVVKYVRSLERTSVRREQDAYLIESVRLVREAIDSNRHASLALYDPDLLKHSIAGLSLLERLPSWADSTYEVSEHVLNAVAQTEHPAGVVAVLRMSVPPALRTRAGDRFGLILDRLADPGNVGTILRTADAAGAGYVVTVPETVDLFAPKVVRAGMGAHFRLPLYQHVPLAEFQTELPRTALVGTHVREGMSIYGYTWPDQAALIVSSEAHGLSPEIETAVSARIHIPMRSGVESLNAAVAASIVMYTILGPGIPSGT